MCMCDKDRERERDTMYTENRKIVLTRARMSQRLQREGEDAYVVTFALSYLTRTASWERGGDLTTYILCVIRY